MKLVNLVWWNQLKGSIVQTMMLPSSTCSPTAAHPQLLAQSYRPQLARPHQDAQRMQVEYNYDTYQFFFITDNYTDA